MSSIESKRGVLSHKSRVSSLKSRVSSLKSRVSSQKRRVSSQNSRVPSHKSRVSSLKSQVSSLKSRVSSQKRLVSSLKRRVSSLKSQVSSLKSRVSSQKRRVSSLKSRVSSLKSRVSSQTRRVSSQKSKYWVKKVEYPVKKRRVSSDKKLEHSLHWGYEFKEGVSPPPYWVGSGEGLALPRPHPIMRRHLRRSPYHLIVLCSRILCPSILFWTLPSLLDLWENQRGVRNVFLTYFDYFFGGHFKHGGIITNMAEGRKAPEGGVPQPVAGGPLGPTSILGPSAPSPPLCTWITSERKGFWCINYKLSEILFEKTVL